MAPELPLEILEQIIDDLAVYMNVDKLSSIRACALVCHSFLPLCRKHIFASVILNAHHDSSPTSDDLNHLLSNTPHLAVYIRNLKYYVNKKEFIENRFSWLLPMFMKLVMLQELNISYLYSESGRKLDWMSSSERKVLLPLLHLPTLTSISLSSIRNFPVTDLASCVNLKKLRIHSSECSMPNDVGNFFEALSPTPIMLERLVIEDEDDVEVVQQLCHAQRPNGKPIIDFSSLKKVTATVGRLDSMTELLCMWSNLHMFDLTIEESTDLHSDSDTDPTSSLKGLFTMLKPSLLTLVDIYIEYSIDNEEDGPFLGLCHELEKMSGQNVVESIELKIWVYTGYDCTRWGELDDVLMGSQEGWPSLRTVSLSLTVIKSFAGSDKAIRELSMTKLTESKRVQFDFDLRVFDY